MDPAKTAPGDGSTTERPLTAQRDFSADGPVDGAGLGRALFLSGDYTGALKAYETLATTEQLPDDRLLTQYMIASCQRKLGKLEDAIARYREIANSGGSETLVKNAQWHLKAIKERQELVAEVERIRARREALSRRAP
jgi:tetratricopeptide (TPR) repeat protein